MRYDFKSEQLNMNISTAQHKLRTMLMFDLVVRLDENWCFRCNQKIDSIEQFSIDHKEPWLHVSPDLFWNLNNIAFSHMSCNNSAKRINLTIEKKKKPCEDGTFRCSKCKKWLIEECFFKKSNHSSNGLTSWCKKCTSLYRKKPVKTLTLDKAGIS